MYRETILDITTNRLALWGCSAVDLHSTPVLMLSVGHDHKQGVLTLHTTEEMDDAEAMAFLQGAVRVLATRIHKRLMGV